MEALDNRLESFDCHLLQLSGEKRSALVVIVDLLELLIIILKVGEVDVSNIDIGISSLLAVLLECLTATTESELVDLVLRESLLVFVPRMIELHTHLNLLSSIGHENGRVGV